VTGTVAKAFTLLPANLRARWLLLVVLMTVAGAGEIAAAAAVFRVASVLGNSAEVARWALILALLFVGKNLVWAAAVILRSRLIAGSMSAMFTKTIGAFLGAPFATYAAQTSADLTNRATYAVDVTCRLVLGSAVIVISEALVIGGVAGVLIVEAPRAVVLALALLATITAIVLALNHRIVARTSRESYLGQQAILGRVSTLFGAITEIRAFRREDAFLDESRRAHGHAMRAVRRQMTALALPRLLVEALFVGSAALALAVTASVAERDLVPLLALYAYAGFRIVPAVNRIVFFIDEIRHGAFAVARLAEEHPSDRRVERPAPASPRAIELRDVAYAWGEYRVLDDLDLVVREGEWVAIEGETGSGKSTLLHLIAGLLEPQSGTAAADPRRIALVPQHPFLLDDTLRENVVFGLPPDEARIAEVLRLARLESFASDTIVGERGVRLSGGERQRIALARALYARPSILLLDEATAALDWETEAEILARLSGITPRVTVVAATHRRHSLGRFDRVLAMTDGRLEPRGTAASIRLSS
jgi:ABC-type multidrug transport system fused ATPase/permease subunit